MFAYLAHSLVWSDAGPALAWLGASAAEDNDTRPLTERPGGGGGPRRREHSAGGGDPDSIKRTRRPPESSREAAHRSDAASSASEARHSNVQAASHLATDAAAGSPPLRFAALVFRHGARAPLTEKYGARDTIWDVCKSAYTPVPVIVRALDGSPRPQVGGREGGGGAMPRRLGVGGQRPFLPSLLIAPVC